MEKLSNLFTTVKAEEEDEPEEEEEEEEVTVLKKDSCDFMDQLQEDLIDPATAIKEACAENMCTSYKAKLDECEERVRIMLNIQSICILVILGEK